jgi:hypothetical protein
MVSFRSLALGLSVICTPPSLGTRPICFHLPEPKPSKTKVNRSFFHRQCGDPSAYSRLDHNNNTLSNVSTNSILLGWNRMSTLHNTSRDLGYTASSTATSKRRLLHFFKLSWHQLHPWNVMMQLLKSSFQFIGKRSVTVFTFSNFYFPAAAF